MVAERFLRPDAYQEKRFGDLLPTGNPGEGAMNRLKELQRQAYERVGK